MSPLFNYHKVDVGTTRKTMLDLKELQEKAQEKIMNGDLVLPESIIKSYNRNPDLVMHVGKMIMRFDNYSIGVLLSERYELIMPAAAINSTIYVSSKYNDAFMLSLIFLYAGEHDWGLMDSIMRHISARGIVTQKGIDIRNAASLIVMRDIYISNRDSDVEKKLAGYIDDKSFTLNFSRLYNTLSHKGIGEAIAREITVLSKEYPQIAC